MTHFLKLCISKIGRSILVLNPLNFVPILEISNNLLCTDFTNQLIRCRIVVTNPTTNTEHLQLSTILKLGGTSNPEGGALTRKISPNRSPGPRDKKNLLISAAITPLEHIYSLKWKHSHDDCENLPYETQSFLFSPRYRCGNVDYLCPKIVENTRTMTKKQLIFDTFSLIYMGVLDFVSIVLLYVYPLIALLSLSLSSLSSYL